MPVVPIGVLSPRVLPYLILLAFLLLFFLRLKLYVYIKEHFNNIFQADLGFASILESKSIIPFLHLLQRKGSYPNTS